MEDARHVDGNEGARRPNGRPRLLGRPAAEEYVVDIVIEVIT